MSDRTSHRARRGGVRLGSPLLFLALAAAFLWRPLATGRVYLPTDLAFRYDWVWVEQGLEPGRTVAQNLLLNDVSDYYYPYRAFASEEIRAGRFPFWNPFILAGTPFFASSQAALLDPVNLLTLPLGPLAHWTFAAWLRIALLGWFTHGFARAMGRSALAAAGAGIVFMISGFVVVWLNYSVVTSLVWMPALFWAGLRLVETGSRCSLAATACAVGALLAGGHPETQFLAGLVWVAFSLHELASLGPPLRRRRVGSLCAAVALGVALAAVQWVPFVDFLLHSNAFEARAKPPAPFDLIETALRLAVLLLPNLGGTRVDHDYWLPAYLNYNEQTGYVGLLAVALALLGFAAARHAGGRDARRTRFFVILSAACVLLTIRAPGFHLLERLPLLDVGQGVRWSLVSTFFLTLLAARGLDAVGSAILERAELRRLGIACAALAAGTLVALAAAWVLVGLADHRFLPLPTRGAVTLVRVGVLRELLDPARFTVSAPLLVLLGGGAVFLALARGVLGPRAGVLVLCALLYLDLWILGNGYNPVTPSSEVFPPNPTLRYLTDHVGRERVVGGGNALRPNVSMLFGLRDLRGKEDLVDSDFARLYGPTLRRLEPTAWYVSPTLTREDLRLLQLASVRFLLSPTPLRGSRPFLWERAPLRSSWVITYESSEALPRAYTVLAARVEPDAEAARVAVLDPGFDPSRSVILEGGGSSLTGSRAEPPPVVWRVDQPERVVLESTLPSRGYLVLTDLYSPDWEATVDDAPTPLLRANHVFRAVALPEGTHRVCFRYRPRLVFACAAASALAAGAALLLLVAPGGRPA